jgi:hypothetical protein
MIELFGHPSEGPRHLADREVRIIGSKSNLLQTLTVAAGPKSATPGVRSSVLKWQSGRDSNLPDSKALARLPS